MSPIAELEMLLRAMQPVLNPGVYVYARARSSTSLDPLTIIASVREPEGLSLILEESVARAAGLESQLRCAWITLMVNSDLQAVGFTAAFSTALGRAGVSCNVVAGLNHDHVFVPVHQSELAMRTLTAVQACGSPA